MLVAKQKTGDQSIVPGGGGRPVRSARSDTTLGWVEVTGFTFVSSESELREGPCYGMESSDR